MLRQGHTARKSQSRDLIQFRWMLYLGARLSAVYTYRHQVLYWHQGNKDKYKYRPCLERLENEEKGSSHPNM